MITKDHQRGSRITRGLGRVVEAGPDRDMPGPRDASSELSGGSTRVGLELSLREGLRWRELREEARWVRLGGLM